MRNKGIVLCWLAIISLQTGIAAYQKCSIACMANTAVSKDSSSVAPSMESNISPRNLKGLSTEHTSTLLAIHKDFSPEPSKNGSLDTIKDITTKKLGQVMTILGKIESRKDHGDGHVFLIVSDRSGKIAVPIFAQKRIRKDELQVGATFKFTGKVAEYRGELEIIPGGQDDVTPWKATEKVIDEADLGKLVTLTGSVISKYNHPQGHIFLTILVDGSGQKIKVPIFKSLMYKDSKLRVSSHVRIKGKVSRFKGQMELIPETASDIVILKECRMSTVVSFNS